MKKITLLTPGFNLTDALAIIAVCLICFATLSFHDGISLYDSACYTLAAEHFVHGKPIDFSSSIFATRIGTWLPQAAYILGFGLNGSITWVTTTELAFFLITLYWFLRKQDQTIAFMSLILVGFLNQILAESAAALGDILLMGILNLSVLNAWNAESGKVSRESLHSEGILTAIYWIIAFFTKESAVLFLPFFAWISWETWKRNKTLTRFWKGFWGTLTITGIAIVIISYFLFGDPLWKIHGAENAIAKANEAYGTGTLLGVLKRWTIWPAQMFAENYGFGLMIMLSMPFILFNREPKLAFWRKYAICIPLTWIFSSQKITEYSPIGLIPRLWIPILPALAIAAAHTVATIARKQERILDILTIVGIGGVWLVLDHIAAREAVLVHKDARWIMSSFHCFIFVVTAIITVKALPMIPDLIPDTRPLILWLVMFPSCFGALMQAVGRVSEEDYHSSYEYGREATAYLKKCNPHRVLSSWIYSGNYPIYGFSDLPVVAYGVCDSIVSPETYLLLNKNQIAYDHSGLQECAFSTEVTQRKPLEESPQRFGFQKIWSNQIYEIWKN